MSCFTARTGVGHGGASASHRGRSDPGLHPVSVGGNHKGPPRLPRKLLAIRENGIGECCKHLRLRESSKAGRGVVDDWRLWSVVQPTQHNISQHNMATSVDGNMEAFLEGNMITSLEGKWQYTWKEIGSIFGWNMAAFLEGKIATSLEGHGKVSVPYLGNRFHVATSDYCRPTGRRWFHTDLISWYDCAWINYSLHNNIVHQHYSQPLALFLHSSYCRWRP